MSACCRGLDAIIGANIVGAYDIAASQLQMNTLKQVPVSVAQALLKGGQTAIDLARSTAASHNLPGGTARDNVYYKLQWHQNALSKVAGTPNAMYAPGDDLKRWTMQAFIEANAAEEGAAWLDEAWGNMWTEIGAAIKALPVTVAKAVHEEVSNVVEGAFGFPLWAVGTGVAVVVLGLGYVFVKSFASSLAQR